MRMRNPLSSFNVLGTGQFSITLILTLLVLTPYWDLLCPRNSSSWHLIIHFFGFTCRLFSFKMLKTSIKWLWWSFKDPLYTKISTKKTNKNCQRYGGIDCSSTIEMWQVHSLTQKASHETHNGPHASWKQFCEHLPPWFWSNDTLI